MNFLQELIIKLNVSNYKFAQVCNLHHSVVNKIIKNNSQFKDISVSTFYSIAQGISIMENKDILDVISELLTKYYEKAGI